MSAIPEFTSAWSWTERCTHSSARTCYMFLIKLLFLSLPSQSALLPLSLDRRDTLVVTQDLSRIRCSTDYGYTRAIITVLNSMLTVHPLVCGLSCVTAAGPRLAVSYHRGSEISQLESQTGHTGAKRTQLSHQGRQDGTMCQKVAANLECIYGELVVAMDSSSSRIWYHSSRHRQRLWSWSGVRQSEHGDWHRKEVSKYSVINTVHMIDYTELCTFMYMISPSVMASQPVQVVSCLSPNDTWDWHDPSVTLN